MKFVLKSKNGDLGFIYILTGSKATKEFRGVLIPTLKYHEIRDVVIHFPEALQKWSEENDNTDSQNSNSLKPHKKIINDYFDLEFTIASDTQIALSDSDTQITVIDKYDRTGLGNWYIEISVQGLIIPTEFPAFEVYQMEWFSTSNPPNQIGIKKNNELIVQY